MVKKVIVIILLSVGLGAFLFLRPYLIEKKEYPALVDRLPEGDFLGKAYLLDIARETSGMLYYHKIPFRDFFSYEFLLGQGKMYGLNLQQPIYFFANSSGDWGALVNVTDSSKVNQGLERLAKYTDIQDTLIGEHTIYQSKELNAYMFYDKKYLFIYKGTKFKKHYVRITQAKKGDCSKGWSEFLKEKQFKDEKLSFYLNTKKLDEFGLEKAIFAHDSDSTSFKVLSYVKNKEPFNFKLKKGGPEFKESAYKTKQLNLHFDIAKLRANPKDPLYRLILEMGSKISFPTKEFLDAWEGDLSYKQGEIQTVEETYIESIMDDNFNVTEVEKTKEVKVPGFSILLSMNDKGGVLLNKLFAKGILRKENNKFYFLFSPALTFHKKDGIYYFYSGKQLPKVVESATNNGFWKYKGTLIDFKIDSLNQQEAFGSLHFPVDRIIRKNKFF